MKCLSGMWVQSAAAAMLLAGAQAQIAHANSDDTAKSFPGFSPGMMEDLGGNVGLQNIVEIFFDNVAGDNRLNNVLLNRETRTLQDSQKKALIQTLEGTPTLADGTAHDGVLKLSDTQYNAVVEDLYSALEAARVSYHTSNRVIGKLSVYAPALVSAYLSAHPSVEAGQVRVGPIEAQQ